MNLGAGSIFGYIGMAPVECTAKMAIAQPRTQDPAQRPITIGVRLSPNCKAPDPDAPMDKDAIIGVIGAINRLTEDGKREPLRRLIGSNIFRRAYASATSDIRFALLKAREDAENSEQDIICARTPSPK
mgnify:CR=1 FL=1